MVGLHTVLARQRVVQCVLTPNLGRSSTAQLLKRGSRPVAARHHTSRITMTAATSSVGAKPGIRMGAKQESQLQIAQDMVNFINEAWSPFHAVGASRVVTQCSTPVIMLHKCGQSDAWHRPAFKSSASATRGPSSLGASTFSPATRARSSPLPSASSTPPATAFTWLAPTPTGTPD